MSKLLPELDDQPKNDYWAPEVAEIAATEEEIAAGNLAKLAARKEAGKIHGSGDLR